MAVKTATWNARSVFRKKMELIDFLRDEAIDIMAITETRLKPQQNLSLPEHTFIRLDNTASSGGGIAIAVRRCIKFRTLPLPSTHFIQAAGIEVTTVRGNFKFLAVYCPKQARDSDGTVTVFKRDLRLLASMNGHFIIAGDLNAKHQNWGNTRANKNGQILWEVSQSGAFTVSYPYQPTFSNGRSVSTLDLFVTNMYDQIDVPETITALSSDHLPVVQLVNDEAAIVWRQRRNYREADWIRFENWVEQHIDDEARLESTDDIDIALVSIHSVMKEAEMRSVPLVETRAHLINIDHETKRLIAHKNALRRRYQRTGLREFYDSFRQLAKVIAIRLEQCKNKRFSEKLQKLPKYSLPFSKLAKVLRTSPKPIPPLRDETSILFTPTQRAQGLADQFAKAHSIGDTITSPFEAEVSYSLRRLYEPPIFFQEDDRITVEEVSTYIRYSAGYKAPGHDKG